MIDKSKREWRSSQMTNYCGYMGKVLLLDLSARKVENYI